MSTDRKDKPSSRQYLPSSLARGMSLETACKKFTLLAGFLQRAAAFLALSEQVATRETPFKGFLDRAKVLLVKVSPSQFC